MIIPIKSFPREIRDAIYLHALKTDKEIVPFPYPIKTHLWDGDKNRIYRQHRTLSAIEGRQTLALGLLLANRQIGREAAKVYYSNNCFRLSRLDAKYIEDFWLKYAHRIRLLVVTDEIEIPAAPDRAQIAARIQMHPLPAHVDRAEVFALTVQRVDYLRENRLTHDRIFAHDINLEEQAELIARRFSIVRKMDSRDTYYWILHQHMHRD